MNNNKKSLLFGGFAKISMGLLLASSLALADPSTDLDEKESPFTAQSLWYTNLDKYAGNWIELGGGCEAIFDVQGFSLRTKGVWPELEKPVILSPQMEFFAGDHLYELWLGDYPERWLLLLRFESLEGSKQEIPEFRMFYRNNEAHEGNKDDKIRNKFVADSNIGWRLRLLISSGEWESEDKSVRMRVDYRSMTFIRASSWQQLQQISYLVGSTKSFQAAGFKFSLQFPNENLDEIVMFRKSLENSSLELKKFKRVKKD